MVLVTLDREGRRPAGAQIVAQLRARMEAGALPAGAPLPSTRQLAGALGLHRVTVMQAYQELWSLGFLELRRGACARVRARPLLAAAPGPAAAPVPWDRLASPAARAVLAARRPRPAPAAGCIRLDRLEVDPRLLPADALRGCLSRALRRAGPALLGYGDPQGHRPLREALARRLGAHGIAAGPDEILVTHGAQQGLDLVLRLLARPGGAVAVESPTYQQLTPLLRLNGLSPLPVPTGPEGLDLRRLEAALARRRPLLLYTMPSFQNPTGGSAPQAHREALLALCARHGVPILEDGFEEEMRYQGPPVLPVKSMDRRGLVIYCGTASKVLAPGLRVGWIAADRACVAQLAGLRAVADLGPAPALQAALHAFLADGAYDRHLARMHRAFRSRMRAALEALRREVDPAWARWEEPRGGYLLWLRLARPRGGAPDWPALFEAHGVRVTGGAPFFPGRPPADHVRLSIATLDEGEIAEGVRRLARALRQAHPAR